MDRYPFQIADPLGQPFDSAVASAALKTKLAELDKFIQDDEREERELHDARAKRDRAQAEWIEVYQGTATALEGLFRLAGWIELADRVRPTQRTIRGEDTGPELEGTEGAAPAEGKPGEAKPAEAKPAEAKPGEAKPAEAKPVK